MQQILDFSCIEKTEVFLEKRVFRLQEINIHFVSLKVQNHIWSKK
jgi:hypothetical protein